MDSPHEELSLLVPIKGIDKTTPGGMKIRLKSTF